jgi:uncharacterized membrane protein YfcA
MGSVPNWVSLAFGAIAVIYSMVGFAGGSSYIALLSMTGVDRVLLPVIGLSCNVVVSSIGSWRFVRRGHFRSHLLWPFVIGSVPMAMLGGWLTLSERLFYLILSVALITSGIRLILPSVYQPEAKELRIKFTIKVILGGMLGLLAGLTGIGGGIFLSPLLLNLRVGRPQEVACTAAMFIFINSMSGMIGHASKGSLNTFVEVPFLLLAAVAIGGFIGSNIGSRRDTKPQSIVRVTGLLTVFVGVRLAWQKWAIFF